MKPFLFRLALIALILSSFTFAPLSARKSSSSPDLAAQRLAQYGYILVKSAGPTIATGTYRTEVLLRMGRPAEITSDGAWLYPNFEVKDSRVQGTLVIRFEDDEISKITLIPAKQKIW
tara:strand:+ start:485 stop:838 length:354 start_codon:yes stop_codon:yes gene_type:complete